MNKRRILISIVLFLLLGLGVAVFANPSGSLEDEIGTNEITSDEMIKISTTTTTTKKVDDEDNNKDNEVINNNRNNVINNINNNNNRNAVNNNATVGNGNVDDNKVVDAGTIIIDDNENNNNNNNNDQSNNNSVQSDSDIALKKAKEATEKAEESLAIDDVNKAIELINALENSDDKSELETRISNVNNIIDTEKLVNDLVNYVNSSTSKNDIINARTFNSDNEISEKVESLTNSSKKSELNSKLAEVTPILEDTLAPEIKVNGEVKENNSTSNIKSANIEVNEENVKITVNGNKINDFAEVNEMLSEDGIYEIVISDNSFNETKITIIVDNTKPVLNVKTGLNVNHDIDLKVTDDNFDRMVITRSHQDENNAYKADAPITVNEENYTLTQEGTYTLVAYDKSGNKTNTIYVAIDKTAPRITSDNLAEGIDVYSTDIKIIIIDKFLKQGKVTINGIDVSTNDMNVIGKNNELFKYERTFTQSGTYEIIAKDKAGNEKKVTFTIDKNAPIVVSSMYSSTKDTTLEKVDGILRFYIKENGKIKLNVYFDKKLDESLSPKAVIGGKEFDLTFVNEENNTYHYVAEFVADENTPEGILTINYKNVQDSLGNKYSSADITMTIRKDKRIAIYDKSLPIVKINNDDLKEIYNDANELNVTISDEISGISTITLNDELVENDTFTITEEGNYKIIVTDKIGNKYEKNFVFDKVAPTIKVNDSTDIKQYYNASDGNIVISAEDSISGIKELKINNEVVSGNTYTLPSEGEYKITATDNAGNINDEITIIYDKTLPKYALVYIHNKNIKYSSKNPVTSYANVNDEVVISVRMLEKLKQMPKFYIVNGEEEYEVTNITESVNDANNRFTYTATYQIPLDTTLLEGEIKFRITDIYDLAGNPIKKDITKVNDSTSTSAGSKVIFDKTAPVIKVNNSTDIKNVYNSTDGNIIISAEDALSGVKNIKINDEIINGSEQEITSDGEYKITAEDKVNNISEEIIINIDKKEPQRDYSTYEVAGKTKVNNTFYAKNGDKVTYRIKFLEELKELPTLIVNNSISIPMEYKDYYKNKGEFVYQGSYIVSPEDNIPDGVLNLKLTNVVDLAGNILTDENVLDASQNKFGLKVVIDNTAPSATNLVTIENGKYVHKITADQVLQAIEGYVTTDNVTFTKNYDNLSEIPDSISVSDLAGNITTIDVIKPITTSANLALAIASAPAGSKIILDNDVALDLPINIDKEITIVQNGTSNMTGQITIAPTGKLTFELENIEISNSVNTRMLQNYGELTLKNGTVNMNDNGYAYGVVDNKTVNSKLTIENMTITDDGNGYGSTIINRGGNLVIRNSSITANGTSDNGNGPIWNNNNGTMTLENVTCRNYSGNAGKYCITSESGIANLTNTSATSTRGGIAINGGTVNINGGIFIAETYYHAAWITNDKDNTNVTISNAEFHSVNGYGLLSSLDDGKQDSSDVALTITDSKFTANNMSKSFKFEPYDSTHEWILNINSGIFGNNVSSYLTGGKVAILNSENLYVVE